LRQPVLFQFCSTFRARRTCSPWSACLRLSDGATLCTHSMLPLEACTKSTFSRRKCGRSVRSQGCLIVAVASVQPAKASGFQAPMVITIVVDATGSQTIRLSFAKAVGAHELPVLHGIAVRLFYRVPFPANPTASIRNCRALQWDTSSTDSNLNVCSSSIVNGICHNDMSLQWTSAVDTCTSVGARLCSLAEHTSGVTAESGCGIDLEYAWTGEPCGSGNPFTPHYWVAPGVADVAQPPLCVPAWRTHSVRCCGDADESGELVDRGGATLRPSTDDSIHRDVDYELEIVSAPIELIVAQPFDVVVRFDVNIASPPIMLLVRVLGHSRSNNEVVALSNPNSTLLFSNSSVLNVTLEVPASAIENIVEPTVQAILYIFGASDPEHEAVATAFYNLSVTSEQATSGTVTVVSEHSASTVKATTPAPTTARPTSSPTSRAPTSAPPSPAPTFPPAELRLTVLHSATINMHALPPSLAYEVLQRTSDAVFRRFESLGDNNRHIAMSALKSRSVQTRSIELVFRSPPMPRDAARAVVNLIGDTPLEFELSDDTALRSSGAQLVVVDPHATTTAEPTPAPTAATTKSTPMASAAPTSAPSADVNDTLSSGSSGTGGTDAVSNPLVVTMLVLVVVAGGVALVVVVMTKLKQEQNVEVEVVSPVRNRNADGVAVTVLGYDDQLSNLDEESTVDGRNQPEWDHQGVTPSSCIDHWQGNVRRTGVAGAPVTGPVSTVIN